MFMYEKAKVVYLLTNQIGIGNFDFEGRAPSSFKMKVGTTSLLKSAKRLEDVILNFTVGTIVLVNTSVEILNSTILILFLKFLIICPNVKLMIAEIV